jgi:hypothetical protein
MRQSDLVKDLLHVLFRWWSPIIGLLHFYYQVLLFSLMLFFTKLIFGEMTFKTVNFEEVCNFRYSEL